MSERPKIKKIVNKDDLIDDDPDMCTYYLQYNEDLSQVMLTISAQRAMTPEEYMLSLQAFINDCSDSPEQMFVEDAVGSHESNESLH